MNNQPERLQKVLSSLGMGSRRAIEDWVISGRIKINGKIAQLGDKITLEDKVLLDNKKVIFKTAVQNQNQNNTQLLAYHKPVGEICTRIDGEGRKTVFDNLPKLYQSRWISIGRLDLNTSGLLLFTNDGATAHEWMHPKFALEREYHVRVLGELTKININNLKQGVILDSHLVRFKKIKKIMNKKQGSNQWYEVILQEGRNRAVRRLFESQGLVVSRLIRTRFGSIRLPRDLKPGEYRIVKPVK